MKKKKMLGIISAMFYVFKMSCRKLYENLIKSMFTSTTSDKIIMKYACLKKKKNKKKLSLQ